MTAEFANNNDMLLIAKLLEDDMRALEDARAAEAFQLNEALSTSAHAAGRFPKKYRSGVLGHTTDQDVVLDILAAEITANKDAIIAQTLQQAEDSNNIAGLQYAQKLAAAEKKCLLDSMFAKRLQQAIDDGEDEDSVDIHDAESVLGADAMEHIMAADMNDKGKGKVTVLYKNKDTALPADARTPSVKKEEDITVYPTCGICMEPFQATHSPVSAARSANSSSRLQFGTYIPCSSSHAYCISCLSGYLLSKLDPEGNGIGNQSAVVFPIRCPECSIAEWPEGIPDSIAERVLSEKGLLIWHHQKLLDSAPRYYCPNPRCSALVQMDEDSDEPQALCPLCSKLICVPCRVLWHDDLTCEEYQELPLDERSPEDQKALQLMKAQNWRRCPKCMVIVELTVGCNHITCRCKTEFCFKCGALWDTRESRCSRKPSCELWDEQMLLEERERLREHARLRLLPQAAFPPGGALIPPAFPAPAPPPPYAPRALARPVIPYHDVDELEWMNDADTLSMRHWFTADMINSLTCQYCDVKLNSLADLRYHLSHVRRHGVYACCGRFFKREVDLERHLDSKYMHDNTVRRNASG